MLEKKFNKEINVKIEVVVNVLKGNDKPYSSSDGYYLRAGAMCQNYPDVWTTN